MLANSHTAHISRLGQTSATHYLLSALQTGKAAPAWWDERSEVKYATSRSLMSVGGVKQQLGREALTAECGAALGTINSQSDSEACRDRTKCARSICGLAAAPVRAGTPGGAGMCWGLFLCAWKARCRVCVNGSPGGSGSLAEQLH